MWQQRFDGARNTSGQTHHQIGEKQQFRQIAEIILQSTYMNCNVLLGTNMSNASPKQTCDCDRVGLCWKKTLGLMALILRVLLHNCKIHQRQFALSISFTAILMLCSGPDLPGFTLMAAALAADEIILCVIAHLKPWIFKRLHYTGINFFSN